LFANIWSFEKKFKNSEKIPYYSLHTPPSHLKGGMVTKNAPPPSLPYFIELLRWHAPLLLNRVSSLPFVVFLFISSFSIFIIFFIFYFSFCSLLLFLFILFVFVNLLHIVSSCITTLLLKDSYSNYSSSDTRIRLREVIPPHNHQ